MIFVPTQTLVPFTDIQTVIEKYRRKIGLIIERSIGWKAATKHLADNFGIDTEQTKDTLLSKLPSPMMQQIPGLPRPQLGLLCPDCKCPVAMTASGRRSDIQGGRQNMTHHWKHSPCKKRQSTEGLATALFIEAFTYDVVTGIRHRIIFDSSYRSCEAPEASKSEWKDVVTKLVQQPAVDYAPNEHPDFLPVAIPTSLKRWKLLGNSAGREAVRNDVLALMSSRIPPRLDEKSKNLSTRLHITLSRIGDLCLRFLKGALVLIHTGPVELLGLLLSQ